MRRRKGEGEHGRRARLFVPFARELLERHTTTERQRFSFHRLYSSLYKYSRHTVLQYTSHYLYNTRVCTVYMYGMFGGKKKNQKNTKIQKTKKVARNPHLTSFGRVKQNILFIVVSSSSSLSLSLAMGSGDTE